MFNHEIKMPRCEVGYFCLLRQLSAAGAERCSKLFTTELCRGRQDAEAAQRPCRALHRFRIGDRCAQNKGGESVTRKGGIGCPHASYFFFRRLIPGPQKHLRFSGGPPRSGVT